ncbi:transposase [Tunturiibacter lichenicola]|uniref:transposase n=1 Tax=Tunturiibacter lichenicola TaxID=2051959 RepID=UPI0036F25F9B
MPTVRQKQSTYAITILTFKRRRHFQRTANAELFINTLFHHRDKNRFQLHAFVVMPDHIHVLITPSHKRINSKVHPVPQGRILLRSTQARRNLAHRIPRTPHPRRR